MAYVTVTGGQRAIAEAARLVGYHRLKDADVLLDPRWLRGQLRLLIDRVMGEGGLYAPELAALALKQSEGDPAEAAFLLRAYRSTLPRNHYSQPIDPGDMRAMRRVSSSFRNVPGGQILGPTYDYTHRLLDFRLRAEDAAGARAALAEIEAGVGEDAGPGPAPRLRKVADLLREQSLMRPAEGGAERLLDITREKLVFPMPRSGRLQTLARGEAGAMVALAYSSMRGFGSVHPTIAELRVGMAAVFVPHPYGGEDGDDLYIGEICVTECETVNSFATDPESGEVRFEAGYGLCFGQAETKAIAMAILDRALCTAGRGPAQDQEFVLLHIDSVESHGFVSHLKLPHYVTFQAQLERIRHARQVADGKEKGGSVNGRHQAGVVGPAGV